MKTNLHQALKTATREQHDAIEANPRLARVMAPDFSRLEYVELLKRYYGFFAPLETSLARFPGAHQTVPNFELRLRAPRVRQDLEGLGLSPAEIDALPLCTRLPRLSNEASFLGVSYVLEGSSLGGMMIGRTLLSRHDFAVPATTHFFSDHEGQAGLLWKEFVATLDRPLESIDADSAITVARETFFCLDEWMKSKVQ